MLLGFVNKAVEYLNRHLDDKLNNTMTELKNIDLNSLKKELSEELSSSLGSGTSAVTKLLDAGSEAFDKFIDQSCKESLSEEFGRMFDVDLDEDRSSKSREELEDLLSHFDMDSVFDIEEKQPEPEVKETEKAEEEEIQPEKEEQDEEKVQPEEEVQSAEEVKQEEAEEEEIPYELTDEESKLLQLISENVNRKAEDRNDDVLSGANRELDSIFSELVAAEDDLLKDKKEKEVPEAKEPVILVAEKFDGEPYGYIENPLVDMKVPEPKVDLVFPEQVEKNDIIQLIKDIQPLSDAYYNRIENFIDMQEKEDKQQENVPQGRQESRYVSSLIDDLKAKMDKEDESKKQSEEAYKQIYENIHKTYPYLSNGFIRNVYELKESIADEYPLDEKIIILHRSVFRNVENLRQYVEIALKHGYMINADEKKMIVDVFKPGVNADGKIITSIFEVANQSALLNGEYEGYRVLFEDDL